MTYQRGSIRKSKNGEHWILRYRVTAADRRRVEHDATICLVRDFPRSATFGAKWTAAAFSSPSTRRAAMAVSISGGSPSLPPGRARGRCGSREIGHTIPIERHYVRDYLIPRWRERLAADLQPIEIQRWLVSLHKRDRRAWTTVSKIRGIMLRIYKIGLRHGKVDANPVAHTECRSKSDYKAIVVTPGQTLAKGRS